jgi:hypothetical protein
VIFMLNMCVFQEDAIERKSLHESKSLRFIRNGTSVVSFQLRSTKLNSNHKKSLRAKARRRQFIFSIRTLN